MMALGIKSKRIMCTLCIFYSINIKIFKLYFKTTNIYYYFAGYGILSVLNQYSFGPPMMYSLLSGRPLVVTACAKFEKDVRAVVNALWLFVPR